MTLVSRRAHTTHAQASPATLSHRRANAAVQDALEDEDLWFGGIPREAVERYLTANFYAVNGMGFISTVPAHKLFRLIACLWPKDCAFSAELSSRYEDFEFGGLWEPDTIDTMNFEYH